MFDLSNSSKNIVPSLISNHFHNSKILLDLSKYIRVIPDRLDKGERSRGFCV